jgi:hypothetical protein
MLLTLGASLHGAIGPTLLRRTARSYLNRFLILSALAPGIWGRDPACSDVPADMDGVAKPFPSAANWLLGA